MKPTYIFNSRIWVYTGEGAWYFITVPKEYALEIRLFSESRKKGFGSVKVEANIGTSTWQTSIFPDKKSKLYLLPIKKEVRTANNLKEGDQALVTLTLVDL